MELLAAIADLFLHLDDHLFRVIQEYGMWTYALLAIVIFCETGFVVTPFLPGDSLLFAAGAFAGAGALRVDFLLPLLTIAAIVGDSVNYAVGAHVGPRVFREGSRHFRQEYLVRTRNFYERHGGKTIVLARFVPIIRTFAPFIAGIGRMSYGRFLAYNIVGAVLWVGLFVGGGALIGNMPFIRENFELAVLSIVALSVLPVVREFLQQRRRRTEDVGSRE